MRILKDSELTGLELDVGGKAFGLARLKRISMNVPRFLVLTDISSTDLEQSVTSILNAFDEEGFAVVAVRSSANVEDSRDCSYAGQFETVLGVTRDGIMDAIMVVLKSAGAQRVNDYNKAFSNRESIRMSIVIQEMLASEVSGVCLQNGHTSMIEAIWGLGEPLVQGSIDPDRYWLGVQTRQLTSKKIVSQSRMHSLQVNGSASVGEVAVPSGDVLRKKMGDRMLRELVGNVEIIRTSLGNDSIDVEFAIVSDQLFFLQARPYCGNFLST